MQLNRALIESSEVVRHFMTPTEQKVKKALCQLLIDKGHRKYAERFWKLDFNIVDHEKHPDFTAAISFEEATVFISDGFLGSGQGIFNQLDTLLRHELAHNLMMHQIRLMYVFKKLHASDPDNAYEHIKCSASLHDLLNYIEDFEISNKRYTTDDKRIVRHMQLNGQIIGGLITEDSRASWANLPLEAMYDKLSTELATVNTAIRANPNWYAVDNLTVLGGNLVARYSDVNGPSSINIPIADFIHSQIFNSMAPIFQKLIKDLYSAFSNLTSDTDKQSLMTIIKNIAATGPQEPFNVVHPVTRKSVCTLYTAEDKRLAIDVLKNLTGNTTAASPAGSHSQEYIDAWNSTIAELDKPQVDDETLQSILATIKNRGGN